MNLLSDINLRLLLGMLCSLFLAFCTVEESSTPTAQPTDTPAPAESPGGQGRAFELEVTGGTDTVAPGETAVIKLITAPVARVTVSANYPGEGEPVTVFQGRADAEGNVTAEWVVPESVQDGALTLHIVSGVVGAEKTLDFQMTIRK